MLDLVLWPDPILKRKAEPVTEFDDELRELALKMFVTMRANAGMGLAAPQVGISKRISEIESLRCSKRMMWFPSSSQRELEWLS